MVNLSSYLVHFEICESLTVEAASIQAAVPIRPSQLRQNSEAVLKCPAVEMLLFHLATVPRVLFAEVRQSQRFGVL